MSFDQKKHWALYLLSFALIGLLSFVGIHPFYPDFSWGFLWGYGIVLAVEFFFVLKVVCLKSANPSTFLKKFFHAEMQKIVLFVLLIAFVLRYSRPDFFGLLLGLIFALVISRLLMII